MAMSVLTNKYAEGYPKDIMVVAKYYQTEQLAIDRMQTFGAEYANVQPHSGAQANAAVFCCLKVGDTLWA